jgi:hypothetical protein
MIQKSDFTQLMNMARMQLVGSSDAGLKATLYDVLSEFFRDTSAWWEAVPFTAIPGQCEYPIMASEGQIIRLAAIYAADRGGPYPGLMPVVGVLQLGHAPNNNVSLNAVVIKNVMLPTTNDMIPIAPDWALPLYHLTILDGLLSRMMLQPNKSYTNMTEGALYGKKWRDGLAQVRVEVMRQNTNGTQVWRFPQSFASNGQKYGVPSFGGERSF